MTPERASVPETVDEQAFETFKWEILGDAALEDSQITYEPLGVLRTRFPEMDEAERQALAERALRELVAEGHIYFFHPASPPNDPRDASDDPSMRLSPEEIDALLSRDDWRTIPLGRGGAAVEFAATSEGETAARTRWPETE